MTKRALGLVEVTGYLGAVVAADAALKAADVSLLNIETVKAGLKTVQLVGDVSAVRAAVDAAVEAIQDKPCYLTSHVISRMDEQTQRLFPVYRQVEKESIDSGQVQEDLAQDLEASGTIAPLRDNASMSADTDVSLPESPPAAPEVKGEAEDLPLESAEVSDPVSEQDLVIDEPSAALEPSQGVTSEHSEELVIEESVELVKDKSPKYLIEELEKMKVVDLRRLAYREPAIGLSKKTIKFANKSRLIDAFMQVTRKE